MKHTLFIICFLLTFCPIMSQDTLSTTQTIKEYGEIIKNPNVIVRIVGLDKFDSTKLKLTKKVIEDNFGFNVRLSNDIFNLKALFVKGTEDIDIQQFTDLVYNDTLTVYLTNHRITDTENSFIVGVTNSGASSVMLSGNYIESILSLSTIHEIGHMYNLSHCENNYCVMSEDCINMENTRFCKKCTDKMYK